MLLALLMVKATRLIDLGYAKMPVLTGVCVETRNVPL